jgi:Tfp pilus assembly protein FimT
MVVVMAIIAIISSIGISAFINARDQSMVSDVTEKFLSSIREAQNRSVSITRGKDTNSHASTDTVVWGVKIVINTNSFSLIYLDIKENDLTAGATDHIQETPIQGSQVTISSYYVDGIHNSESRDGVERYIFYSSPFAKTATGKVPCTSTGCKWQQTINPTRDWEMSTGNGFMSTKDYIHVLFSYKGHQLSVVINNKGDAYIE